MWSCTATWNLFIILLTLTLDARGSVPYMNTAWQAWNNKRNEGRASAQVRAVEFFENASPMGCLSHSKSQTLTLGIWLVPTFQLVLTSTSIHLQQGQLIKLVSTCFQYRGLDNASHSLCGHNHNTSNYISRDQGLKPEQVQGMAIVYFALDVFAVLPLPA